MRKSSKNLFLLFLSFLVVISPSVVAQKDYIVKNKVYTTAKVFRKDYSVVRVRNLQLINDSTLTYQVKGALETTVSPMPEIRYVSVRHGTRALTYGLTGAGIGLFSVALVHIENSVSTNRVEMNWVPLYLGMTVGCGAVGAIIGLFDHKWKRLYFKQKELVPTVWMVPGNKRTFNCSFGLKITI